MAPHYRNGHQHDDGQHFDEHYRPVRGEIATWTGVLTQALLDASSKSRKPENLKAKREALAWIRGYSEDFQQVCDMAQMDPELTHRKMIKALENDCVWRLPSGLGWRSKLRQQLLAPLEKPEPKSNPKSEVQNVPQAPDTP